MAGPVLKCLTVVAIATVTVLAQEYPPPLGSPPFQCQHSSDQLGQVYTPNISESYFREDTVASYWTTHKVNILDEELTYTYTTPAESPDRDCAGLLRALEYCYKTDARNKNQRIVVFNFLVLTQDGQQFTVRDRFRIRSVPQNTICRRASTFTSSQQLVCCDKATISNARRFVVSTQSPVTIGVLGRRSAQLLAAPLQDSNRGDVLTARLSNSGQKGSSFMAAGSGSHTLPMLRILLDQEETSSEIPEPTSPQDNSSTPSGNASSITTLESEDNDPTSTGTPRSRNSTLAGIFAGGVTAIVVLILAVTLLTILVIVSRRRAARRARKKSKPPNIPPRPKQQQFTITRNEAYRIPTVTSTDENSYSYIDYTTPTLGGTHNGTQTSTEMMLDNYGYVIPS